LHGRVEGLRDIRGSLSSAHPKDARPQQVIRWFSMVIYGYLWLSMGL
jgi:hypothetical protein